VSHLKKSLTIGAIAIFLFPLLCQAHYVSEQITVDPRITYEQWHMPNGLKPMGVVGLHGLVDFKPWLYGGLGLYSAVSGQNGGFFGLALEGGVQHTLFSKIAIDGGIRVGGAGGHTTPVGGGLFYEPYIGLKYHFTRVTTGIYYSYVHFDTGSINSHQIGFSLSTPFHFHYFSGSTAKSSHSDNYIAALVKSYFPTSDTLKFNNQSMQSDIEFLGVELGHYLKKRILLFFNFSGAFHGNQNGYADELLGIGYRFPLFHLSALNGIVKMAAGSGGGGSVNTGGGFIYSPTLGVEYRFTPAFGVELNGGYIAAPEGHFKAGEASLLLKYYFSHVHGDYSHSKPWRIRIDNQTYFKPRSSSGSDNPTMQLLGFDVDYFMKHYFYLTGQTAFAYIGKNTGGYFSGLLGVGAETSEIKKTHLSLFSELLAGTAGGAGLSIGDGALVEPVAGLEYHLNRAVDLQTSVGCLYAIKGDFRPITLTVGLGYKFN